MPRFRTLDSAKEYKIAWITALRIELTSAIAFLDEQHSQPADFVASSTDDNLYIWGNVSGHNIVILSQPEGQYGLTNATTTAERLRTSLPHIRIGLLVGIGAGIPDGNDIRLGDVAVSLPEGGTGGVVQYDFGKAETDGFKRIGMLSAPPRVLLNALRQLRSTHDLQDSEISSFLRKAYLNPKFAKKYGHPGAEKDYLPRTTNSNHEPHAREAPLSLLEPSIHYGTIASGNVVVKDAQTRDKILTVIGQPCICFEMEAAGLMNNFPCLVIRGICDYADGDKNDDWQPYASATAAAFAKELLQYLPETEVEMTNDLKYTLQGIQVDIRKLDKSIKKVEQKTQEERVSECIQMIFSHSHTERKDRNLERVEGTCQWFTNHSLFQQWNEGSSSQALWVRADPGCGKSVLARYLIDEILPRENRMICYFFFKDDFLDQKTALISTRTILYQLFSTNQSLITENILETVESRGKEILDSFRKLWQMFLTACQDLSGDIVCVFDGLDECREEDISDFIRAICGSNPFPTLPPKLKILALSRPYFHIQKEFGKVDTEIPVLVLSGDSDQEREMISAEIDLVIKHRIDVFCKQRHLERRDHDFLLEEFMSTSHKTYLWAHLTLAFLEDTPGFNRADTRGICKQLPPTVDRAYENILDRSFDKIKTRLLLEIIIAAERPLSVRSMCLLLAFNGTQTNYDQLEDSIEPEDQFKNTIRELCGLFVIVVDGKVYLLHQTAREFLLKNTEDDDRDAAMSSSSVLELLENNQISTSWKQSFPPKASNQKLAERCIFFLRLYDDPNKNLELYNYCATFWITHFRRSSIEFQDKLTDLVVESYIKDLECCRSWFRLFSEWKGYTKLYKYSDPIDMWPCLTYDISSLTLKMASITGLTLIVKDHLSGKRKQDWSQETLSQTLWCALHSGCLDTIEILIHGGADLNAYCWFIESGFNSSRRQYPLYIAVERGLEDAVKLFLQHGANVDCVNKDGDTPLHEAIQYGPSETMIKILLEHGASLKIEGWQGKDALTLFYGQNHQNRRCEHIRNLFYTKAPDVLSTYNLNRFSKGSPPFLSQSAANGCLSCVKDLLHRKALINCKDLDGNTPLHHAVSRYREVDASMVTELLHAGADIHARNAKGETPLLKWLSQEKWQADIFEILLDVGADINDTTLDGSHCLHIVKSVQGLERLISLGLDVNIRNASGMTPLLKSLESIYSDRWDCLALVRCLVNSGAHVNIANHEGTTAVMKYCCLPQSFHASCEASLKMLWNDDLNEIRRHDILGKTALHYCMNPSKGTKIFCYECAEFLLKNGLDIDAQNFNGETIVAMAARLASESLVERYDHSQGYPLYKKLSKVIHWFLERGANVNIVDTRGETPLVGVVRAVNAATDYSRDSLFLWFAPEHYMDIPRMLIEFGANPNAKDANGRTFLIKICSFPFMDAKSLRFMLSHGADPDIQDNYERTALDYLKLQLENLEYSKPGIQACIDLLEYNKSDTDQKDDFD